MPGLPERIANKVTYHLDHLQDLLGGQDTIITLIARRPLVDQGFGEGDVIYTRDSLDKAIMALENRRQLMDIQIADGSVLIT